MNHMQVYPEHVMLAIMSHNDNTAMRVIKKLCNVDIQEIYDKVYSQLTYRIVDPPMSIKNSEPTRYNNTNIGGGL